MSINIGRKHKKTMKEEIKVNIPYREEDKHLNLDGSVINLGNYKITIISRPTTQTKDFLWYIDQYLDVSGSSTSDEIVNWFEYQQADALKHRLKTSQFSLVPWEIKMGLFKFICEAEGQSWKIQTEMGLYSKSSAIKILPQEFINDLF